MALKGKYIDPRTGSTSMTAHMVLRDPVMRDDAKQATVVYAVYASDEAYHDGLAPLAEGQTTLTGEVYALLRAACLDITEPAVQPLLDVNSVRVPD